jgi:CubicO group peptidase (beta-lactamase class C family)
MRTLAAWISTLALLLASSRSAAAPPNVFTQGEREGIEAFLATNFAQTNAAMVVGLVDRSGSQVFSAGTLDNGTDHKPDGDSVFFIGSVSKTFTALLLLEMAARGEVSVDDPVAKYLPPSVKPPTRSGKEITLLHLATHSAGLPINPDNMTGSGDREQYESYTVEQMYHFLSKFELSREPGAAYEYSNVGMALLGHALERRAETSFESLVVERICRPLGMGSTCISLTPKLVSQRAVGHDAKDRPSLPWKFQAYRPAGDIHSTANDLLKYAAAQAGLTTSALTPSIEASHVIRYEDTDGIPGQGALGLMGRTAMDWVDRGALQPSGMELLGHAGGAGSYHAWIGFDKRQRRGFIALTTANDFSLEAVGWTILQRLPLSDERKHLFARELVGIGVALEMSAEPPALRITRVFPESPAALAGLNEGTYILKIDEVATAGKSLNECVELIRGPIGAKVRLELSSANDPTVDSVVLTRQRLKI